jgi:uncharacterized lipoprotein YmbA
MKFSNTIIPATLLAAAGWLLAGCSNLKPVSEQARFFVLAPHVLATTNPPGPRSALVVGLGRVEVAEYLQRRQLAMRKGSNEIVYADAAWAERLDKAIQRVLGANLASILGETNVLTSTWRRGDVAMELHLSVLRFESDQQGRVTLEARWRITKPDATQTWHVGRTEISQQGPPPATDPDGAVAALGRALGGLSREIADAVGEVSASHPSPPTALPK